MIYNVVGCGGTFDHLHIGHKAFLRFAFSHGKHVVIGLTSDKYVSENKKNALVAPYIERYKQVEAFLATEGFTGRYTIVPIDTIFGPAIDPHTSLDCLVTTEETKKGAEEINAKRSNLGLSVLPVITMPLLERNGKRISSTRIRAGEIDREGNTYCEEFSHELLLLPQELRDSLQVPFGRLFLDEEEVFKAADTAKSIVIGDATTAAFHQKGLFPKIAVIDFIVQREKRYSSLEEEGFTGNEKQLSLLNPPGAITPALWDAIVAAKAHRHESTRYVITIEGEEDLAVLPAVLILPLGFTIYYGQPNKGIVKVVIDMPAKERAKSLLRQFKRA